MKIIGPALKKAADSESEPEPGPDYSAYEGNFEARPWGGEVAVRQWGDKLALVNLPSLELDKSIAKLKHVEGHRFIALTKEGDERYPVVFEMDEDGKAQKIHQHSGFSTRID